MPRRLYETKTQKTSKSPGLCLVLFIPLYGTCGGPQSPAVGILVVEARHYIGVLPQKQRRFQGRFASTQHHANIGHECMRSDWAGLLSWLSTEQHDQWPRPVSWLEQVERLASRVLD